MGVNGVQEAALTCKAEELDQVKGIVYIHDDLASAERQLLQLRFRFSVHALLPHKEHQRMSRMAEHMSIAHHEAINRDQSETDHQGCTVPGECIYPGH